MGISAAALVAQVQVNIPFPFLQAGYLEQFLHRGLNPEIGLDAYSLGHYPPGVFRRAARAFQGAGRRITLHGPFQDLAPGALDDGVLAASRRRLRQAFRYLPVFRPVAVVCHLGYEARHYRWDQERWLARSAATWKELAALAAPHGVTVMLENVYETEPELFLEVLNRVGAPNLKVCFDVGHLLAFSTGDFPALARNPGPGHRAAPPPRQPRGSRHPPGPGGRPGPPQRNSRLPGRAGGAGPSSPWSPTRKAAWTPPWTTWPASGPGRVEIEEMVRRTHPPPLLLYSRQANG